MRSCIRLSFLPALVLVAGWSCPKDDEPASSAFSAFETVDYGVQLRLLGHEFKLGGNGAPRAEQFAIIGDAVRTSDGSIFVSDQRQGQISIFDGSDSLVALLGRPGSGPGEFGLPGSIGVSSDRSLHVYDEQQRRISVFAYRDRTWQLDTLIPIPIDGRRMCLFDGSYVVAGLSDGLMLHIYSSHGELEQSFGAPFGSPPVLLQQVQSYPVLACSPEQHLVLLASRTLPEIRAYSVVDGHLVWKLGIPEFRAIEAGIDDKGRASMRRSPRGSDVILGLAFLNSDIAIAQVGRLGPDARSAEDVALLASWMLDVTHGRIVGAQRSLPRIISAGDKHVLALTELDWPQLDLYTFEVSSP